MVVMTAERLAYLTHWADGLPDSPGKDVIRELLGEVRCLRKLLEIVQLWSSRWKRLGRSQRFVLRCRWAERFAELKHEARERKRVAGYPEDSVDFCDVAEPPHKPRVRAGWVPVGRMRDNARETPHAAR